MSTDETADGFLSRWARRKAQARSAATAPLPLPPDAPDAAEAPAAKAAVPVPVLDARAEAPLPTLADVALLTRESDYSRFVASGVDDGVKQAAMKKLFADPHFNVMDGLDTYIDDYGKPDPIPLAMLQRMSQSKVLRLFEDDEEDEEDTDATRIATSAPEATLDLPTAPDDHADLRLQQDDVAGQPGPDRGLGA